MQGLVNDGDATPRRACTHSRMISAICMISATACSTLRRVRVYMCVYACVYVCVFVGGRYYLVMVMLLIRILPHLMIGHEHIQLVHSDNRVHPNNQPTPKKPNHAKQQTNKQNQQTNEPETNPKQNTHKQAKHTQTLTNKQNTHTSKQNTPKTNKNTTKTSNHLHTHHKQATSPTKSTRANTVDSTTKFEITQTPIKP
eukprot:m.28106 g.28106  ORF g.28106 m.28106 type:complete len:198 (-) comp15864_c0_seq1:20-613(-)